MRLRTPLKRLGLRPDLASETLQHTRPKKEFGTHILESGTAPAALINEILDSLGSIRTVSLSLEPASDRGADAGMQAAPGPDAGQVEDGCISARRESQICVNRDRTGLAVLLNAVQRQIT